ncbi:MAG: tRNA lysidine(34) synthetase TilS [Epsilonproteobacteria bacterium]|nr:tRNA lysidine(34) synthetase TilS [Campylobacterota bacterium]
MILQGINLSQELSELLNKDAVKSLQQKKNLLAFSAGIDSTALFFLLKAENIDFDIAIVNYGKRAEAQEEVAYAQSLANQYAKKCFIKEITLKEANFEKEAREARYDFFELLIEKGHYQNLITAHQLNDRLEWFLMQFTKGAGTVELLGFEIIDKRENYQLIRPLINTPKKALQHYLDRDQIPYFIDQTNLDYQYKRNEIRHTYTNTLLEKYESGIIKSFAYLDRDRTALFKLSILEHIDDLYILEKDPSEIHNIRAIDKILKKLGYILSEGERKEILKQSECVISHQFTVAITAHKIYIAPYVQPIMEKKFKELCRTLSIPTKIRGYLWQQKINPQVL